MDTNHSFTFGSFRLSPVRREVWKDGSPVTLGTRAFDVLLALVRRRGELATKNELMAEVWPGTIVEENNLTTHIATLRRLLGEATGPRFILTVPGRGYRFVADIQTIDDSAAIPQPPPPEAPKDPVPPPRAAGNLPAQLTPLVGRAEEVQNIVARLDQHRLVTIAGAGGVGKTRLAIEAASRLAGRFTDGVYIIEFAPFNDPRLTADTVARVLGVRLAADADATKVVASYLRNLRILLVFDNCEHLVEAISGLAAAILATSASGAILATSRERLQAHGENCYHLLPLEIPDATPGMAPAALRKIPSVALFLDRAAAAVDGFALDAENAEAIATICRRLDGIPFAIELAAPWLRVLSPAKLAQKLDDRFRVLNRGVRAGMPHHQTLAALIGWSYDLLSDFERCVLDRLSVFPASFSAEAAAAAIGAEAGDEFECLGALASLVDKSLVMVNPAGSEPRYRLLETTWAYASEKLGPAGKRAATARLAIFVARLFTEAERSWPTTSTAAWRSRYEPELEILRASLIWAFGDGGDIALGVRLVSAANWFWEELGLVSERLRWLNAAASAIDDATPPPIVGKIRMGLNFSGAIGQRRDQGDLNRPVAIFRAINEPIYLALALRQSAAITMRPGDVAEAERALAEAEAILRPLGTTKPLCGVLDLWATARRWGNDTAGSLAFYEEALLLARRLGYARQIEVTTLNLADLEFEQGLVASAIGHAEEGLHACLSSGNLRSLCIARCNLAGYFLARGEIDRGAESAREGLRLAGAIEDRLTALCCIEHLALVAAHRGLIDLARSLVGFGDAEYEKLGTGRYGVEAATRGALAARLAPDVAAAVWTYEQAAEAASKVA